MFFLSFLSIIIQRLPYLRHNLEGSPARLCIAGDGNLLILHTALTGTIEGDGHVAVLAWGNTVARIVGHGAAAAGLAAADDEVGIAGIGKMERIGDALTLGEHAEVMHVVVERHHGKGSIRVQAGSRVGIGDKVGSNLLAVGRATAST